MDRRGFLRTSAGAAAGLTVLSALDAGTALTKETVKEYFRVKQGGEYKPALRARERFVTAEAALPAADVRVPARGGALTSRFRLAALDPEPVPEPEPAAR